MLLPVGSGRIASHLSENCLVVWGENLHPLTLHMMEFGCITFNS